MSSELQKLQSELKEYKVQLDTVQAGLQADPDNVELQNLAAEINEIIALTRQAVDELKGPEVRTIAKPIEHQSAAENQHYTQYTQDALTPGNEDHQQSEYEVGDTVLAKWVSGDKGFYPARITSKTGSATDPVYIVTFKSYATSETLRSKDLRALSGTESRKRKLDANADNSDITPVSSAANAPAPASLEQFPAPAKKRPAIPTGPPNPAKKVKKVKANRELEEGKSKWQDFATKGKHKGFKAKESMFRTPEGVKGKVGFIGSGKEMRKDATRSRHVYDPQAEDDV